MALVGLIGWMTGPPGWAFATMAMAEVTVRLEKKTIVTWVELFNFMFRSGVMR